ncbi:hypothetical protein DERF_000189 [Dermatophagoides farinae]|uniref:Uncharacterized protein n=1 Tax=Dermatophagoides farinae TaxID=6954 RepID=A0A922I9G4_DERFA|nr:uncharacterized protein LOC124495978 [Dermatophagoides farinae]KAH7640572.1 hypothetical protein HUG17_8041 [Dermatophagoides farinae]KAH9526071.1 hypothetical protein DERF_000189 [Dermatophagoides farinae]
MHQSQSGGNQQSIWWWMATNPSPLSSSTEEKLKKLVVKANNNSTNEDTWLFTTNPIQFHYPLSHHQFDNNNNNIFVPQKLNKNKEKMDTLPRTFNEMAKDLHDDQHGIVHKINYKHYAIMTVLFTILVLSMIWLLAHDSHKCTVDQHTVDTCLRRLTFFSEINHFPTNGKELDKYCKDKMESVKCLRHFVEGCLEPDKLQRSYFKKFVSNYQRQLDKICLRYTERQRFLEYSDCLSESDLIHNVSTCQNAFQNQLIYIAQNLDGEQRLQAACCAFGARSDCLDRTISTVSCASNNQVRSFVLDQIEGPFLGIIDSVCEPYHSTRYGCQQLVEPTLYEKLFEHPETLIRKYDQTKMLSSDEMDFSSPSLVNDSITNSTNSISSRFKVVQLIFYEKFLSYFIIIRSN